MLKMGINPLSQPINHHFHLDQSKLLLSKYLQTTIKNSVRILQMCPEKVNIVGKGENAGYQLFLLFPQCFQRASFSESVKLRTVW